MHMVNFSCNRSVGLCAAAALLCAALMTGRAGAQEVEAPVSYNDVMKQAEELAKQPYQAPPDNILPEFLKKIGYDQWRDIRFKTDKTLWGNDGLPFKVRFFHPGFLYKQPVVLHYVDRNGTYPIEFAPDFFDYGLNNFSKKIPAGIGFAGFRIHYPINDPKIDDEVAVFLGASYFRAVAKDQQYGMSARGLAIDTALQTGEEFPFFKEFWIVKPSKRSKQLVAYALLDSPSVAGAYEYTIRPGPQTRMDVKSKLFFRKRVKKLGIAPLTSMYFFGENSLATAREDFRPEVHDSDGLAMLTKTGEWIWRPLVNPQRLEVDTFTVGTPLGFGLMQRDTDFDHYQDVEARTDIRPSVWVTPKEDWGDGHVELVQIPTRTEYNDNANAFWVPAKSPEAGDSITFAYTMDWCFADFKQTPLGHVTDTRIVRKQDKETVMFVIDFQGKELNKLSREKMVGANLSVSKGYKITEHQVFKNTATQGWRLVFQIHVDGEDPLKDILPSKRPNVVLRAYLTGGSRRLTETWDYVFQP